MVAKLESLMKLIGILSLTPEGQALIPFFYSHTQHSHVWSGMPGKPDGEM